MGKFSIFLFHLFLMGWVSGVRAISSQDFPPGFFFGAGTSAYQVEGAAAEDGKKPSIWDTFTHAGRTNDKKTGDVAADQYHKYKEDVQLMHEMGLGAYRFSISWSRLIPDGRGSVNPKGLQYYNNLIDELVSHGIEPHVTLYHFDLPQALQDEYGGLTSPKIVEDFTAYADVCFREFGDRVKYWITINEPNVEPLTGYDMGVFPPSRCSHPFDINNCTGGNSTTEPYVTAHHMLLSHVSAANLYKDKYQAKQHGYIGITLMTLWIEPWTTSPADIAAAQRARDFHIGWFMDPLTRGTYPDVMRKNVGSRLPFLSANMALKLKRSYDFIGLNHYNVVFLVDYPASLEKNERDYFRDMSVTIPVPFAQLEKKFIGLKDDPKIPITPWSLQRLLEYIKLNYGNPPVMIHENGYGDYDIFGDSSDKKVDDLHDPDRVECIQGYIESLLQSIRNGSNARGYFVWSLVDCFETAYGYTARFGLYKVDFNDENRKRYPRLSARWYSSFLRGGAGEMGKHSSLYIQ